MGFINHPNEAILQQEMHRLFEEGFHYVLSSRCCSEGQHATVLLVTIHWLFGRTEQQNLQPRLSLYDFSWLFLRCCFCLCTNCMIMCYCFVIPSKEAAVVNLHLLLWGIVLYFCLALSSSLSRILFELQIVSVPWFPILRSPTLSMHVELGDQILVSHSSFQV